MTTCPKCDAQAEFVEHDEPDTGLRAGVYCLNEECAKFTPKAEFVDGD